MKKLLLLIALLLPALFVTAQGIKNGLKEEPTSNSRQREISPPLV